MHRPLAALILVCAVSIVVAQPVPNGQPPAGAANAAGGPRFSGSGSVGVGDSPQHRQAMLDAMKDQLSATDKEWETLLPRIQKVMDARRATQTGAGISWRSSNGGAPIITAGSAIDTPPGKAMQEVRTALDDKDTSNDDILKKLAAMREAREKARADLAAAQKELKEACTPRQEAILVTLGQLD